jgi:hypothetical protein
LGKTKPLGKIIPIKAIGRGGGESYMLSPIRAANAIFTIIDLIKI